MSFPRYPAYKDSGVEWLGEVPEHWDVWKLSQLCPGIGSGTTPKSDMLEFYEEGDIPWVVTGDLNDSLLEICSNHITVKALAEHSALKLYDCGSVVVAMYGATIGKAAMLGMRATVNQACCVLPPSEQMLSGFLLFVILSTRNHLISLATGGGQPNINQDVVRSLKTPAPSLHEQVSITTFLDRETAKIDALIAEQQRLIELLQEKRQAVISHAVTKGLNPDAPMKDSGVEWLGEVPEHWEVGAFSYALGAVGDVDHYMPETVQVGMPYVMTGDLKDLASQIDFEGCKQVAEQDYKRLSRKIKTAMGDLIMARYATIGTVAYVDVDREFLVSYSCVTIKPDAAKADGMYLFFCLKSDSFFKGIQQRVNTNTQENIGIGDLKKVKVALPPLNEQLEIVKHLQAQVSVMDGVIKASKVTVVLLNERRSALISAAVTGQIDVRGLVPEAVAA